MEPRPDLVPATAGLLAAEADDGGGAAYGPAHAGQLEALRHDRAAAGLDRPRADEQAERAEAGVAHPRAVGLEVAERLLDLLRLRVGGREVPRGGEQRRDVTAIELGQPLGEPAPAAIRAERGCDQGAEGVQVLAGVVEVDDLDRAREVLAGQVR